MQDGQRIQNSATSKALEHWAPAWPPSETDANDLTVATRSAARLAAEAAFAPPQTPSWPQLAAQVIVRRTRSASLAGKRTPEANDGPSTELTPKAFRVFRVEAAPNPRSVEASLAAVPSPTEASTHNGELPAQAPTQSPTQSSTKANARRIAADKRPGPVLHVIHASPERKREAQTPQPRLDLLTAELELVTPVLQDVARAQTFSLVDERFAREWLRLSRKVDALHLQIQAQLR